MARDGACFLKSEAAQDGGKDSRCGGCEMKCDRARECGCGLGLELYFGEESGGDEDAGELCG